MIQKTQIKAIVSGSIGNLVEWYDWYVYSAFSIYFSSSFFPHSSPTAQLLNTAGIFAVGFFMRPIGGWLFGNLADNKGRKIAMTISVLLMSFGSLLIALCPSFNSIGILAPILLLLARLLQGLSVGGEYGTAATYLSEMATPNTRGFFSSFQYVTLIGGQLIALSIQLLLQGLLSDADMHAWGWRIPFFIGAALSFVALYLRAHMQETDSFKANAINKKKDSNLRLLLQDPKAILIVMGLTLGGTVAFYTYSTYMQKFLVNTVHLSKIEATKITFGTLLFFTFLQPLLGWLSDKIGRKPLLLSFGILGTLFTVPLMSSISQIHTSHEAFILILLALIIVSGYTSVNAIVKAELFPTEIRALGVGLSYSIAVAIFGGSAEYIALYCKNSGVESAYYWYVTICIFISLIIYAFMKDTKRTSLIQP